MELIIIGLVICSLAWGSLSSSTPEGFMVLGIGLIVLGFIGQILECFDDKDTP